MPTELSTESAAESAADTELLSRFAQAGDGDAFAILVGRYGPLVLGVCRRVLGDAHAAEDAFQATFLVLARKAGVIDRPQQLAGWLHGVAARVAQKTKVSAARRQEHERRAEPMPPPAVPELELAWQELRRVLDEELTHLPEPDRSLLVLCYLENQTHEQAAARLELPRGSVAWRLTRAREALRRRLERRGVALGVGPVALLSSTGRPEAVPADLAGRTADLGHDAVNLLPADPTTVLADDVLRDLDDRTQRRLPWWVLALILAPLLTLGVTAAGRAAWSAATGQPFLPAAASSAPGEETPVCGSRCHSKE